MAWAPAARSLQNQAGPLHDRCGCGPEVLSRQKGSPVAQRSWMFASTVVILLACGCTSAGDISRRLPVMGMALAKVPNEQYVVDPPESIDLQHCAGASVRDPYPKGTGISAAPQLGRRAEPS